MAEPRSHGAWTSPITAASLVEGAVGLSELVVDGDDVWWSESRPTEGGRTAIVRWRDGVTTEVTPPDANVRTRVHEYGGGSWWVAGGVLYYVEFVDQRLRRLEPGGEPVLLTPEPDVPAGLRYADGRVDPHGSWFVCVRERHGAPGADEAVNEIVAVPTDGSMQVDVLVSGADFYSSPRISPDGARLAWLLWNHPNMPWDDTELWTGHLDDNEVSGPLKIAGGPGQSVIQPQWGPDGRLWYIADFDDVWSVYVEGEKVSSGGEVGGPPWVFGDSSYIATAGRDPVYAVASDGRDRLVPDRYDVDGVSSVSALRSVGDDVVFIAGSHHRERAVVRVTADGSVSDLRAPRQLGLDPGLLPPPEEITYPTGEGEVAYGRFYQPANPDFEGPADERPPLIVMVHGGPTGASRNELSVHVRYWTSRGFAVVDVDYRGSSGHGRAFRKSLDRRWGIADVEDCVNAARYLADRGDVDGDRLLIRGGSAGGYTTLCALAFHDAFAAGASAFGVADLAALATETHKFESRYLDGLLGPYPEARDVYEDRSPIHHTEGFSAPMIVLQGDEDQVVPMNQAEMIVDALRSKGLPVAYVLFEGEQHGFRRAENIIRAVEAELSFYGQVLGFDPADQIEPVLVENL